MEIRRHIHVLWRYRIILLGGLALAVLFAGLAAFKIDPGAKHGPLPLLDWRSKEVFTSTSRLLVTQEGFPYGRATYPSGPVDGSSGGTPAPSDKTQNFADPSRFTLLALIYSNLITSQQVRSGIPGHPKPEDIQAEAVPAGNSGATLPLIQVKTTADSSGGAQKLNQQAIDALQKYLTTHNNESSTPETQRVIVQEINPPIPGKGSGHALTGAIVAFLLTIVASIALAYVLENMWPSWRVGSDTLQAMFGRFDERPEEEALYDEDDDERLLADDRSIRD